MCGIIRVISKQTLIIVLVQVLQQEINGGTVYLKQSFQKQVREKREYV